MEETEAKIDFPKWNWGAFILTWIWGIGNKTYISLLMFVPIINWIIPFILGFKGYTWAYYNGDWKDRESFFKNQRDWAKWAFIAVGAFVLIITLTFGILITAVPKNEPFKTVIEIIENDPICKEMLGNNIKRGFFWTGSINTSGDSGDAEISFVMKGDKSKANCYFRAYKMLGSWNIEILAVTDVTNGENILLIDNR